MIVSLAVRRPLPRLATAKPQRLRGVKRCRSIGIDVSQFEGMLDEDTSYAMVYGGLGLAATGFAATFFVAPNFRSELKEAEDWKEIFTQLVEKQTPSITPLQAAAALSANPKSHFAVRHFLDPSLQDSVDGCRSIVQLGALKGFVGWDLASVARRVAFAFFGIPGTERNPNWLSSIEAAIEKEQEVIVMCELGGTLETKVGMETGFQSRSLKAVHFLQQAGFKNITHMKGGISEWKREGLPMLESS